MKNKAPVVVVLLIIAAGALFAMSADHMKTQTVCRDVRLYMEGGTSVALKRGGLTAPRTLATVYERKNNEELSIGSFEVESQMTKINGVSTETYVGKDLTLSIFKTSKPHVHGNPATLQLMRAGKKINVALGCVQK